MNRKVKNSQNRKKSEAYRVTDIRHVGENLIFKSSNRGTLVISLPPKEEVKVWKKLLELRVFNRQGRATAKTLLAKLADKAEREGKS